MISATLERRVLEACEREPKHARTLQPVKAVIDRLVKAGCLRRFVRPPATAPLWIEITDKGVDRLIQLRASENRSAR